MADLLHPAGATELLILLAVANGTPVFAKRMLGQRLAWPLDGGSSFLDGRPLFGASKTVRGVLLAILAATVCAVLLDLAWTVGALAGGGAMVGDLLSSFAKRRMKLRASSRCVLVDQVPESLLPALLCRDALGLGAWDVLAVTLVFFLGEILLSRVLYRLHLRDQPY